MAPAGGEADQQRRRPHTAGGEADCTEVQAGARPASTKSDHTKQKARPTARRYRLGAKPASTKSDHTKQKARPTTQRYKLGAKPANTKSDHTKQKARPTARSGARSKAEPSKATA